DYADAQPVTLSGGQLQRVLFARLMLQRSRLWLLDEPFNGIDSQPVSLLMSILERQQQAGAPLLVVLHDPPLVARYISDLLSQDDGPFTHRPGSPVPLQEVAP
uniref:ATP-binding cassette domain-containing protein n=1 Tax=Pantoea brenneri TaxID=472694 RepID=UPI000A750510